MIGVTTHYKRIRKKVEIFFFTKKGKCKHREKLRECNVFVASHFQITSGCNVNGQRNGKGIIIFMITDLKNTVPLVIKACPEVTVNGE